MGLVPDRSQRQRCLLLRHQQPRCPAASLTGVLLCLLQAALLPDVVRCDKETLYQLSALDLVCGGSLVSSTTIDTPPPKSRNEPHTPVLMTTSKYPVTVTISLTDHSGKSIFKNQTFLLQHNSSLAVTTNASSGSGTGTGSGSSSTSTSATMRLLFEGDHDIISEGDDEDEGEASKHGCEDFFLLDGRAPVDLPETWQEAGSSFLEICQGESLEPDKCEELHGSLFASQSVRSEAFAVDDSFCNLLLHELGFPAFAPAVGRRLKSGWTGHSSRVSGGHYAYSNSMLGHRYGHHMATPYGFAGRALMTPFLAAAIGMGAFWVVTHHGGYGSWYRHRHLEHSENSTGSCSEPFNCAWKLSEGEEMYRNDLLDLAFEPDQYTFPLTLALTQVRGQDFEHSRICPPMLFEGVDPPYPSWWKPPPDQDLFFTLSKIDTEDEMEDGKDAVSFIVTIVAVVLWTCLMILFFRVFKKCGKSICRCCGR